MSGNQGWMFFSINEKEILQIRTLAAKQKIESIKINRHSHFYHLIHPKSWYLGHL